MTPDGVNPRSHVQSVGRALAILRHVASSGEGLTTRQISEAVGLNRQTAYHLVHTLVAEGFLAPNHGRRYRLGLGVAAMLEGYRRQLDPPEHLMPYVRTLSRLTGETAYVVGWSEGGIVALGCTQGPSLVGVTAVPLGMVGSAHARASGKVLLAFAPQATRDAYLWTHPTARLTPNTLVDRDELEREFDRIRVDGYAVDREEFVIGVSCMAAPLDAGTSPFAFSISAPTDRFVERFDEYRRIILETAASASASALTATTGETR